MKAASLFLAASMMLIALPASAAPDLTGIWCVSMSSAYSAGTVGEADYDEEEYEIEFVDQEEADYGVLFYGRVDVGGGEFTYFSGVLDGEEISLTHWDSVTRGKLPKVKKDQPLQINFVNNAFNADDRSGKTAIGVAIKGNCPQ